MSRPPKNPFDQFMEECEKPCNSNADSYIALRLAVQRNPIVPEKPQIGTGTTTRRWTSYQQVDCNKTNSKTLTAFVSLDAASNEKIVTATASLENTANIQGVTGPTLGTISGNTVPVSYGFNGLDKVLGNCPGGGHATVVVTFVVQRQAPIPQTMPAPSESVTVTLPNGLSLKAAIISIVETDNASARFSANCGQTVLETKVSGGAMSAGNRTELINQLQYRLINPGGSTIALKAVGPSDGGVYDIDCVP